MKMYHKNAEQPISVHPDRVEEMKRKGWTDTEPKSQKAKTKSVEPTEATTTEEVTNDGNS